MRVCALSDTHLYRPEIPDGDVLIHGGDLCASGSFSEFMSEIGWLGKQPHLHKILIPGNHDRIIESQPKRCRDECSQRGIQMLIDESIDIDGVSFFGCPHTPEFMNWAFMHAYEEARQHWSFLETAYKDIDVWITHGPPYGIHDACPLPQGCPHLFKAVEYAKPRVHATGHIHEGWGGRLHKQWPDGKETLFANISVLNGYYQPVTTPTVFDIEAGKGRIDIIS